MKHSLKDMQLLLSRLLLALFFYPLCKILFFFFNLSHFPNVNAWEITGVLFMGLRFDLASLVLVNLPFILFHNLPFSFNRSKGYEVFLKGVFLISNGLSLLAECIDLEYYKYTLKRMGSDFFDLMGLGKDTFVLLPRYVADFWYILLVWLALFFLLSFLYNRTRRLFFIKPEQTRGNINYGVIRVGSWFLFNILLIGIMIIAFRGGLQKKPINPINAAEYVSANHIPLILNTTFSIVKSFGREKLPDKNYFLQRDLIREFIPIKQASAKNISQKTNVFIIILESFSKEYTGLGRKKSHTPFLDSLMQNSLVFDNGFANAKRSIEGIPAILAGIPSFMNDPFITSAYSSNQFDALPGLFRNMGYSSAFFHGGTNGTMGFDAFCKSAGFEHYYGRHEYNNEEDYDGEWGIWDEPFLQYSIRKVDEMQEPFFATVFTLSSHHPYQVPAKYSEMFGKESRPLGKAIAYTDYSLKKFFEVASRQKWYSNTLFVITADHTGSSTDAYFGNSVGGFEIPIIYFRPGSILKGINRQLTQQIDILPTVLSITGINKSYFSLGNSAVDSMQKKFVVNHVNSIYHIMQDSLLLQFDGTKTIGLFKYQSDSLLQNNLINNSNIKEKESMEKKLKAIIQIHNKGMIYNQISASTFDKKIVTNRE